MKGMRDLPLLFLTTACKYTKKIISKKKKEEKKIGIQIEKANQLFDQGFSYKEVPHNAAYIIKILHKLFKCLKARDY